MHGDKKWIRDHSGRLKKSNDRTFRDWRGDLNRGYKYIREMEENCPDCIAHREEIGVWKHPCKWDRENKKMVIDTSTSYFFVPYNNDTCEIHRDLHEKRWSRNPHHKKKGYMSYTPSRFRRTFNRKERIRVKQMLHMSKTDEDILDDISNKQMEKLEYYW